MAVALFLFIRYGACHIMSCKAYSHAMTLSSGSILNKGNKGDRRIMQLTYQPLSCKFKPFMCVFTESDSYLEVPYAQIIAHDHS